MAGTGPGPQQRFPSNIVKVSFPKPGGYAYLFFEWAWGMNEVPEGSGQWVGGNNNAITGPLQLYLDFSNTPFEGFDDVDLTRFDNARVPDFLSDRERQKDVPIKDPITNDMLAHYVSWTPHDPFDSGTVTTPGTSFPIVVLDKAHFQPVYNGMRISRVYYGEREEARNILIQGLVEEGFDGDTSKVGVTTVRIWWKGMLRDVDAQGPDFPAQAAEQLPPWEYHTENGTTGTAYGRNGRYHFFLNLAMLKRYIDDPDVRKATTNVVIPLRVRNMPTTDGKLTIMALTQGFVTGTQRSFPLNSKGRPGWNSAPPFKDTDYGDTVDFFTPVNDDQVGEIEIFFPVKDPQTGKMSEPEVTVDLFEPSGGEG